MKMHVSAALRVEQQINVHASTVQPIEQQVDVHVSTALTIEQQMNVHVSTAPPIEQQMNAYVSITLPTEQQINVHILSERQIIFYKCARHPTVKCGTRRAKPVGRAQASVNFSASYVLLIRSLRPI